MILAKLQVSKKRSFLAFSGGCQKDPKIVDFDDLAGITKNDEPINDRTGKLIELPRQLSWEISSRVSAGCKRTSNNRAGHVSGRVEV